MSESERVSEWVGECAGEWATATQPQAQRPKSSTRPTLVPPSVHYRCCSYSHHYSLTLARCRCSSHSSRLSYSHSYSLTLAPPSMLCRCSSYSLTLAPSVLCRCSSMRPCMVVVVVLGGGGGGGLHATSRMVAGRHSWCSSASSSGVTFGLCCVCGGGVGIHGTRVSKARNQGWWETFRLC